VWICDFGWGLWLPITFWFFSLILIPVVYLNKKTFQTFFWMKSDKKKNLLFGPGLPGKKKNKNKIGGHFPFLIKKNWAFFH